MHRLLASAHSLLKMSRVLVKAAEMPVIGEMIALVAPKSESDLLKTLA